MIKYKLFRSLGSYGVCSECNGVTIETPVASECTNPNCGDYTYYGGHS